MTTNERSTTEGPGHDVDRLLRLLADSTRRRVLRNLTAERNDTATIDALATALGGEATPGPDSVREARIQLHHTHLPKLDDAGVVDVDWERKVVEYRDGYRFDVLLDSVLSATEMG